MRTLTDASGAVTDTYTYDAFGGLTGRTGSTPNEYLYAGERFDPETGLYHLRARYMRPETGRFFSMDSYEGSPSDPASLHKYTYAEADPVNRIDPTGHSAMVASLGGLMGGSIIQAMTALSVMVVAAAIVCALDFAATAAINEAGGNLVQATPCDSRNRENRVYRGTRHTLENEVYMETGHLLSDAARISYRETGSLAQAYATAAVTHVKWNALWGSEIMHAQAHGAFGTEMGPAFGMDRTFVSVTRHESVARQFAKAGGTIYTAVVPRWEMVPQTLRGAGEGEWLIRLGRPGFTVHAKQ